MSTDSQPTDAALISAYLDDRDQRAFEQLLDRHYPRVYRRVRRYCRNEADAEDLLQQVWFRVIENIHDYRDEGKFGAFLERVAANLVTDAWRKRSRRETTELAPSEDNAPEPADSRTRDTAQQIHDLQAMEYLTEVLIPELPCDQRMIFLLKHESEYWEEKQRLQWDHLARLNGIDVQEAWQRFEDARNRAFAGRLPDDPSRDEALLLFLVWSQAQRPSKRQKLTEQYFADLLGVPVNTLKTRYRAATQTLSQRLQEWQSPGAGAISQ